MYPPLASMTDPIGTKIVVIHQSSIGIGFRCPSGGTERYDVVGPFTDLSLDYKPYVVVKRIPV